VISQLVRFLFIFDRILMRHAPALRDYLLRLDDMVTCSSCRTRFEVPSHQSLVYLHELEGLPKDVEEEE